MSLWIIFITGLTVGGLTCLAIQGGLLASVITARGGDKSNKVVSKRDSLVPTLSFLVAKLIAYTILGFLLGAFGEKIGISQTAQIIMQFVAGFYMIAIAFNLLNIHPIFRYAVIQPPRFLVKKVKSQSRSNDLFAPAILGAMTIFIPCGTTLAMETLAISSANAFSGAAIMAAFVLGTMPLFFGVGFVTSILGENYKLKFIKIAAICIVYLGLVSVNGALTAVGSPVTFDSIKNNIQGMVFPNKDKDLYDKVPVTQIVDITVSSSGYSPKYIKVQQGMPVTLKLIGKDAYSCASAFRIPAFNISKNLKPNEIYVTTFTPIQKGKITFTCSMGMYTGIIEVI